MADVGDAESNGSGRAGMIACPAARTSLPPPPFLPLFIIPRLPLPVFDPLLSPCHPFTPYIFHFDVGGRSCALALDHTTVCSDLPSLFFFFFPGGRARKVQQQRRILSGILASQTSTGRSKGRKPRSSSALHQQHSHRRSALCCPL